MAKSTVLRNATVVDGTQSSGFVGDVAIEGDRIAAVGLVGPAADADEKDLSGLVLAPGFIDSHTHYDAQVLWDGDLTPSCWHGVTSVVMGNCGYSVAPVRPEHHDVIVLTLEAVEGMSRDALRAGIDWSFETYPDYLKALESRPLRLNVGGMIGHTAVRYYVMGEDAADRAATDDEVARMAAVVEDALEAGALGFSTSQATVDNGAYGKPVPSRMASRDELLAIMDALAAAGRGVVQILPGNLRDVSAAARDLTELAERSGRRVTFSAVLTGLFGTGRTMDALQTFTARRDGRLVPQMACRPIVQQVTLRDPFFLTMFSEAFVEALQCQPDDRQAIYENDDWRRQAHEKASSMSTRLAEATVDESDLHASLRGSPTLGELATQRSSTPLDVMIDLALEERLETRFKVPLANDNEEEIGRLLNDARCLLSLSDAGAHQSQICDAVFSTHLLGYWVRERKALPLETAVWRLTGHPAEVFGLHDRGVIRPGAFADLVAFDPAAIGAGPPTRVHDLPGGADRLVARSTGIEHVWVNGQPIVVGGRDVDAAPGRVLRSSRD